MEEHYLNTYNKSSCNGCGACTIKCPVSAISMKEDNEGFYYPEIDKTKCINCGLCRRVCSNVNNGINSDTAYMARLNDDDNLKRSASGGMFYALANYVISNGGEVFGAEYDDNFNVVHNHYGTLEELEKLRGSKYVRSNIFKSFKEVENLLKVNKLVLFTGTPCQCNAIKCYLKKEYDNLILCDIICHSNPSQKVFSKFIDAIEKKYKSKVVKYFDRPKQLGWRYKTSIIELEDGRIIYDGTYTKAFLSSLISRPSCYDCKFSGKERVTDFTIGDMWGIEHIDNNYNDNKGLSLVLINSEKAFKIFEDLKNDIFYSKISKDDAFKYNHNTSIKMHKNRNLVFKHIDDNNYIYNLKKYSYQLFSHRVLRKIRNTIKKFVKR